MRLVPTALTVFLSALAMIGPAAAQVTAEQTVSREVIEIGPDGRMQTREEKAVLVAPGDRVVYRLRYANQGAEPAKGLVLVMPVPKDVLLLAGSAQGPGEAGFSVDGGERYGALASLSVEQGGTRRPATASDVTHVRWTLSEALPAGGSGEVAYKAQLR